jgi:hypothetical protein
VVQTATAPGPAPAPSAPAGAETTWARRIGARGLLVALPVLLVLGYLGWVLPSPGGSLLVPTAVVAAAGAAVAFVSWVVACFRPAWRNLWAFAVAVVACTALAAVWTFEFSLPVAMAWDTGATPSAQRTLLQAQHAPINAGGVPYLPCSTVETGSIGPLPAPYRVCAISSPEGHFVIYTAVGTSPVRGVAYTDVGAATFPDECSRHLVGPWWMFVGGASGSGCPFGYRFHGGP